MYLDNSYTRFLEHVKRIISGTTTVGMVLKDYVVLAADKRATAGHYVAHKHVKKIIRITDNVAMTTAGLVADAQALADYLRAEANYYQLSTGRPMSIRSMAYMLGLLLNSSKYSPYIVQLLIGGYDAYEGPKLFAVELFGDVTEEKFTATGSGSPIAIGIIEAEYDSNLEENAAVQLAARAVALATMRDVFSGEGVDVVVVGKGYYREYTFSGNELKKLIGRS